MHMWSKVLLTILTLTSHHIKFNGFHFFKDKTPFLYIVAITYAFNNFEYWLMEV